MKFLKTLAVFLVLALVAAPIAAIVTILLSPFFGWIEAVSGIESLGHSGPAEWCYVAVYLALFAGLASVALLRKRKQQQR